MARRIISAVTASARRSFLFATFHGGGNLALIIPVVRRLAERGHRVRVLAGPRIWGPAPPPTAPLLDLVTEAGATAIPLPDRGPNPHAGRRLPGLIAGWTPHRLTLARNLGIASWWSPVWARETAAEIRRDPPDVLASDYYLLGAIAAAEQAGTASAVLVHNATYPGPLPGRPPPYSAFGPERSVFGRVRDMAYAGALRLAAARNALPSLNAARVSLGLRPLRSPFEQYRAADRVLILSSRVFDFAAASEPANVRYVGAPHEDAPTPPWSTPWPEDDHRPLVLVSLSTLDQGQGALMRRILDAVAEVPVRALVTLGPSLPASGFSCPPNARLELFVPHVAVLPRVAVLVTQCGLSTVSKALGHGVPMVCLPLIADQPDNAARVVAAGAGLRLRANAAPSEIAAAISRVLSDSRYRERAERMAAQMSRDHGAEAAADELEEIATSGTPQLAAPN